MKIFFALSIILSLSLLLVCCQKEVSSEIGRSQQDSSAVDTSKLLIRTVFKTPGSPDSVVTVYSYDNKKKLAGYDIVNPATDEHFNFQFTRNANGIVTKIIKTEEFTGPGGQTYISNEDVFYDVSVPGYSYIISTATISGDVTRDSIVFNYDANKRINLSQTYEKSSATANLYVLIWKTEYIYNAAGDLTGENFYDDFSFSGNLSLNTNGSFEYDNKTAPLVLKNEAFLFDFFTPVETISLHNITKATYTYSFPPSDIITMAYTYNSENKPATALHTGLPQNVVSNITYYYQ